MSDRRFYEYSETKSANTNLLTDEQPAIQARMPESEQKTEKEQIKS